MTGFFQHRDGIDKHCKDCYQFNKGICCYTERPVDPMKVCDLFIKQGLTDSEEGYTLSHKGEAK